jgi:hypothetical protein
MIEGGGVGVKGSGFEAKLTTGFAPVGNGGADFAQDGFGRRGFETEPRCSGRCSGDGGLFTQTLCEMERDRLIDRKARR